MRYSIVMLACAGLAACVSVVSSAAQRVALDSEVTLAPGSAARTSEDFEARFVGVASDSRCPRDTTCVWAGEVKVLLEIRDRAQPPSMHEVVAGGDVVVAQRRVTVVRVEPQPPSERKLQAAEYRVTLKISAA